MAQAIAEVALERPTDTEGASSSRRTREVARPFDRTISSQGYGLTAAALQILCPPRLGLLHDKIDSPRYRLDRACATGGMAVKLPAGHGQPDRPRNTVFRRREHKNSHVG